MSNHFYDVFWFELMKCSTLCMKHMKMEENLIQINWIVNIRRTKKEGEEGDIAQ